MEQGKNVSSPPSEEEGVAETMCYEQTTAPFAMQRHLLFAVFVFNAITTRAEALLPVK